MGAGWVSEAVCLLSSLLVLKEPVTSILQKQAADISVEDGPYFVMELSISSTHAALQETRRGA